ncbi:MAG: hypothetical protein OEY14_03260, partial [Myxococcales bacterium]|nr:hypothetical protein [Myxococcales bacterium]
VMRATIGRVRRSPLRVLGRASLLAYWVHLELVYGIAGGRWKSSLSYPEWLLSLLLLSALMGALAWLRLYPLAAWLRRRRSLARAEGRRIETRAQ